MASNADIGKRLENYVTDLVKTGRHHSRSEVLQEGVHLVEERKKKLAALDAAINRGLADADAGRVKPLQEVADRLGAKYRQMAKDRGL